MIEYEMMVQPRSYIINRQTSNFLNYFEYVVMTMAIWNAIWTPLTIGFDRAKEMGGGTAFVIIDGIVDTIFWMDIFLGFFSSYKNEATGDEIFDLKKIAKHYIFDGSFLIDFLSTFPFTPIFEAAGVDYRSILFLFADIMSLLKA